MMQIGSRGLELIKRWETLELKAYHGKADPDGVWTIGWGHTHGVYEGMTISTPDAENLLKQDLEDAENAINEVMNAKITTQAQFDAMCSLAFNVGTEAFQNSTMLRLHNNGQFYDAAMAFLMWVFAGGKKRRGLIRRRCEAAGLYCDDKFIGYKVSV